MSRYVMDTDILTLYQLGHATVGQHRASHPPGDVAVTIISVEEKLTGWYSRIRQAKKRDELARAYQQLTADIVFLGGLGVVSFTEPAILRYEDLLKLKLNVGKMDLRIAAITLE